VTISPPSTTHEKAGTWASSPGNFSASLGLRNAVQLFLLSINPKSRWFANGFFKPPSLDAQSTSNTFNLIVK
jgi:hypothetical protein